MTKRTVSRKSSVPAKKAPAPVIASIDASATFSLDETTGTAAIKRIKPLMDAIPAAAVTPPKLNLRVAALAALGIYDLIESKGLRPRFAAQAKIGELDIAHLDRLPDLARGTFYIRLKVEQASAVASEALVPATLAVHAQEVRRRMLKLLDFHFEEHSKIAPILAFIRRGTGYQDLAEDLIGMADLYHQQKATLQLTPNHYQASDEQDATRTASELLGWLGGDAAGGVDGDQVFTSNMASRAGQLLVQSYDEVAATGRYVCRHDPDLAERFQSLYALARTRSATGVDETGDADSAQGDQDTEENQPTA